MSRSFARTVPSVERVLETMAPRAKPWKEYIRESDAATDGQASALAASQGRPNFGMTGFGQSSTERFLTDYAAKWRRSGLLGENSWQMYRHALPSDFELHPRDPLKGNDWMKLHEKNPMFLSKFLNGQGAPLAPKYSGLKTGAHIQMMLSVQRARRLGLLPPWGNPYHERNMKRKPIPRVSRLTKDHIDTYRSQWIENERIKSHFGELQKMRKELTAVQAGNTDGTQTIGQLPHFPATVSRRQLFDVRRFHYAMSRINPLDAV
eukprot:TRINITY_DN47456_c0_g1_i1.p1 TRINITY_DN47456_c0_g1~~TRINITY_DN47456_c0_g1_i1.p1  ORF type:complete len:294 (+),score=71.12 TRINITY_DN47456_c0_g1_i1:96-884(+)